MNEYEFHRAVYGISSNTPGLSDQVSDFVTCASCIFCALFSLRDAKFLFQDAIVLQTCH